MKLIFVMVLALLSFVLTLVGALALTDNLNKEALDRIIQGPPPPVIESPGPDDLDALSKAIKKKQDDLKVKDARVKKLIERQQLAERDMKELNKEMQETLKQLGSAMDATDAEARANRKKVAQTLEEMDSKKAADVINSYPAQRAADILGLMEAKAAAKILDEVDPDKAASILSILGLADY